jgi:hypothetical protein
LVSYSHYGQHLAERAESSYHRQPALSEPSQPY